MDVRRVAEIARAWWRGWSESDLDSLGRKLDDPRCHSGGIVQITGHEYRALAELNRRIIASNDTALRSPLLVWVTDSGLHPAIRVHQGPAAHPAP